MAKSNPQVVLVMGVAGVGKSTFIRYATGCDVEVGHGQASCTIKFQCFQIPKTNFYLMVTPGFDDAHISDSQILRTIAEALVFSFKDKAEIQGALYFLPVMEARMRGSGRKSLIMFRKVLGMRGMKNCRLVTTKWNLVDKDLGVAREKELCESDQFWQPLIAAGATTIRFGNSTQSAMDIFRPLLFGPSSEPHLVEEVIRDGKSLPQTKAGRVVNDDVEEAKKTHAAEIKQLEKDKKDAIAQRDFEFAAQLEEERKEHLAKVKQLEEDKKLLA